MPKAVQPGKEVARYLAQPVLLRDFTGSDVVFDAQLQVDPTVEAGVLVRASYDEAYALLAGADGLLLCRYDVVDRIVLARREWDPVTGWITMRVESIGSTVRGRVVAAGRTMDLEADDSAALPGGYAGVVVNPLSPETGGRAAFRNLTLRGLERDASPRFDYRFTGAVVREAAAWRVRLAARTSIPSPVTFEVATDDGFSEVVARVRAEPDGKLGSVRAWIDGLVEDTTYVWRAVAGDRVTSEPATFKTPPPPGAAVRFAYGCCTSGRVTRYPSFDTARAFEPEFYLHSGDWGYADLTSAARRADHFQSRWIRLLRAPEVRRLLERTPLLFWQDDHDYQADNGWSGTVQPYAVEAFDELHANPSDDYFDFLWGDVHVWCLDCRLHATDPEAPDGPDKTRLGLDQKAWLMQGMAASAAPLQVVASPMVFRNKPDDDPGWHSVYAHERDELLKFFSDLGRTVLILSGDSHGQRLIHHHEFGELYEINSSGTDFPGGNQGNNDPEHTLINLADSGFAVVNLAPAGAGREVVVTVVESTSGQPLFEKRLPIL